MGPSTLFKVVFFGLAAFCCAKSRYARLPHSLRYEGGEHQAFGNVNLRFKDSVVSNGALGATQKVDPRFQYSFGDLIALFGDYYSGEAEDEVICLGETFEERVARAKNVYEKWYLGSAAVAKRALSNIDEEARAAQSYVDAGYHSTFAYEDLGLCWWLLYETSNLLLWNLDHFQRLNATSSFECAARAYEASHYYAQTLAAQATTDEDLRQAYAADAAALHWLTDSFAAGHTRVPRDENAGYPCLTGYQSSLMVNMQHNEDNYNSLLLDTGSEGVKRFGGDATLLDFPETLPHVQKQVQESADRVFAAFRSREPVRQLFDVPQPVPPAVGGNRCPRYAYDENGILRRRVNILPDPVKGCELEPFSTLGVTDCPAGKPQMFYDLRLQSWEAKFHSFSPRNAIVGMFHESVEWPDLDLASQPQVAIRYLAELQGLDCSFFAPCCSARQRLWQLFFNNSNAPISDRSRRMFQNHPLTVTEKWMAAELQPCAVDVSVLLEPTTVCLKGDGAIRTLDGRTINQDADVCSRYVDNDGVGVVALEPNSCASKKERRRARHRRSGALAPHVDPASVRTRERAARRSL